MIKIDLITGFLGAGKTTFLKRYARWLIARGLRVGILENDYGAVNVDMMLLQDLPEEHCGLEMVAGACDHDCHVRRFKTKLIAMGMSGYDRVLVEPSGIFDVDEFFDALREEPLDRWYEIGSVISVVDADLEEELSEEADYLLASQTAGAGLVVLSKTQLTAPERQAATVAHLNRAMERFQCPRRFDDDVFVKAWDELTDEDFQRVSACGYRTERHVKLPVESENGFASLYYLNHTLTPERAREAVERLFADPACGKPFRIKGFLPDGADGWQELNATRQQWTLAPIPAGQAVLIVIGEELNPSAVDRALGQKRQR